jgi:hypothetical protein
VTVHRDKFLIIKPTRSTNFSNLFWNETLHISGSYSVHHQEFFTVHTAIVYVIQVLSYSFRAGSGWNWVPSWSCSKAVSKLVWHIPLLCVQWKTPDDGHRNCPKYVQFHSKNKFEKTEHLVGFIIGNISFFYPTVFWDKTSHFGTSVVMPPSSGIYLPFVLNKIGKGPHICFRTIRVKFPYIKVHTYRRTNSESNFTAVKSHTSTYC